MAVVSIVIPTYNGARYVGETIDSCLNQTFRDLEVIVVIDGSTDETEEIVKAYRDPRLTIVKTSNRGQASAMNTGFAAATGTYFSWTSDDNVYMDDAFEAMVHFLEGHPGVSAVATDCLVIDARGRAYAYTDMMWQCFLYRREAAEKVGPHSEELRAMEDVQFAVRLNHVAGPIARIPRPYLRYRRHGGMRTIATGKVKPLISVQVNYDLITQGYSRESLHTMFLDRMRTQSIYGRQDALDRIIEFAEEKQVPFLDDLKAEAAVLKSPKGWLINRALVLLRSKSQALQERLRFYYYLAGRSYHSDSRRI